VSLGLGFGRQGLGLGRQGLGFDLGLESQGLVLVKTKTMLTVNCVAFSLQRHQQ